jgi:hypothetical protein
LLLAVNHSNPEAIGILRTEVTSLPEQVSRWADLFSMTHLNAYCHTGFVAMIVDGNLESSKSRS